jgi:hypothetical protein
MQHQMQVADSVVVRALTNKRATHSRSLATHSYGCSDASSTPALLDATALLKSQVMDDVGMSTFGGTRCDTPINSHQI